MKKVLITPLLYLLPLAISISQIKPRKPEDALKEIFPGSNIEIKNVILSDDEIKKVKELSGVKLDSRLVSFYIVRSGDSIYAYGYVDVHIVRTRPEAVLYVIDPDGTLDIIEILSFREPPEYMADQNWLEFFKGKSLQKDMLRLKKDIPNMSGATLTSMVIVRNARKALAIWKIIFGNEK